MNQWFRAGMPMAKCVRAFFSVLLVSVSSSLSPSVATAQSLPSGWTASNIGNPALRGSAASTTCSTSPGCVALSVSAAGTDVWGASDQFVFVHMPLDGDGTIVAQVRSLVATDSWAKAGVMIRESLGPDSRHAFVLSSASRGIAFQRRRDPGGTSTHTAGSAGAAPTWLRLDRAGSTLTAYESFDGAAWTRIGSDTIALPSTVY